MILLAELDEELPVLVTMGVSRSIGWTQACNTLHWKMFRQRCHQANQVFWILVFLGSHGVACAQETLEATWRSGVSRWNGTSYENAPIDDSPLAKLASPTPYGDLSANAPEIHKSQAELSTTASMQGSSVEPVTNPQNDAAESTTAANSIDAPSVSLALNTADDALTLSDEQLDVGAIDAEATDLAGMSVAEVIEGEETQGWRSRFGFFLRQSTSTLDWLQGWDSQAELGLDGSSGNAETLGVHTGFESKRSTKYFDLELDVDYRKARNRQTTTEDNGRISSDFDRMFNGTSHSAFGKFGTEWDRFKAFDLRLNLNGGYGYHWIRRDDASLVTRFGAGASREIGAPNDDWIPEAVFGVESERKWSARQKMKQKLEYFPAWENFGNFRLVADLSWETTLDEADRLRLKWSMNNRYDSTPQGARRNDLYYSLLLLYKF